MLTRSGVAKRLGKSIATVRRMEGVELHPTRGSNGVHLFDPDEVDAAARGETVDRSHRVSDLAARGYADDGEETDGADAEDENRVASLEVELSRQRRAHAAEIEHLRQEAVERERRAADDLAEAMRSARAQAERESVAVAVGVFVESLTDRELAQLGEDGLDELAALLGSEGG
jgi:hypothetical protein